MSGDPPLRIVTLGRFAIYLDGRPLTSLGSRKAEALLVYLAWAGQPVSRDILVALFWPDYPQKKALASLSTAVSTLRRHLSSHIVTTRQTVALNRDIGWWLDTAVLQMQLLQWRERSGPGAEAELEAALALYQGEFLAGLHVRDSQGFEEWALLTGERLRNEVTRARLELARCCLVSGRYHCGIEQARCLIQTDPLHERAHRLIMKLLAHSGERNAALVQYETFRQTLDDELGVEPAQKTTALYEHIRTGTAEPGRDLPG